MIPLSDLREKKSNREWNEIRDRWTNLLDLIRLARTVLNKSELEFSPPLYQHLMVNPLRGLTMTKKDEILKKRETKES